MAISEIPLILPPIWDKGRENQTIIRIKERGLPLREEQLIIGDATISERVVFEIKRVDETCNDVWQSLIDDRIHVQSQDRKRNYEINILIIQVHDKKNLLNPYFGMDKVRSLIKTLELSFNTHVHITDSLDETIDLVYEWWEHEKKGVKYVSAINKTPKPKTPIEQQIYFLSGLIDCGDKSAWELLLFFKTPWEIVKWIMRTEITYTAGGNPRKPDLPPGLTGYGPQFFLKNHALLGLNTNGK